MPLFVHPVCGFLSSKDSRKVVSFKKRLRNYTKQDTFIVGLGLFVGFLDSKKNIIIRLVLK